MAQATCARTSGERLAERVHERRQLVDAADVAESDGDVAQELRAVDAAQRASRACHLRNCAAPSASRRTQRRAAVAGARRELGRAGGARALQVGRVERADVLADVAAEDVVADERGAARAGWGRGSRW